MQGYEMRTLVLGQYTYVIVANSFPISYASDASSEKIFARTCLLAAMKRKKTTKKKLKKRGLI